MSPVARIYPLRSWLLTQRTTQCFQLSLAARFWPSNLVEGRHKYYHTSMPRLVAETADGSLEDIVEDDLYKYKRNRWIYNESVQLSQRYVKFDLQQLLKAAISALSDKGAHHCTRVLKLREGLNSKAFLLTMDNGLEIIARLPNPIAGPAYYTTASEVATCEFLRDALDIPAPRIIAWSADARNPVGAEYILEEKALGTPLGSLWYQWPMEFKLDIISQVVRLERRLASTTFPRSGCTYFKNDIPSDRSTALTTNPPLPSSILERFSIGPLVSSGMWRGQRVNMEMNRGPYTNPHEFVEAMATNEMQFVKTHGRPRMNYHRSSTEPEAPDELLDLLHRYLKLAPAMVPPVGSEETHLPTLWHPDLHLNNVFVDPGSRQITRIIDWQSTAVMPFFYQCDIPRMIKNPGGVSNNWDTPELPDNYDSLDQSEKEKIKSAREREICHKYYLAETKEQNPKHWVGLGLENICIRTEPSRLVVNVWEDRDVFFLRQALYSIAEQWEKLCPESGPCPVAFSEQEIKAHGAEEEVMGNVAEILRIFQDGWGLPPDGMVDSAAFEEIRDAVAEMKESFLSSADNEEERELFSKIWPYQDADA